MLFSFFNDLSVLLELLGGEDEVYFLLLPLVEVGVRRVGGHMINRSY